MVLWAIKLSKFDVYYRPNVTIKAQALANFVADFTTKDEGWGAVLGVVWTDRSFNQHVSKVGVVLQYPQGDKIKCAVHLQFPTTNNEAKYEALLISLDLAKAVGASLVVIYSDSQVIVKHVNGDYETKGEHMKKYLSLVKRQMDQNFTAKFVQIPREKNKQANRLAKAVSTEHMTIGSQVLSFI